MTEQLKYITSELNKQLGTNFDIIKFDALNEVEHLQILMDLLAHYDAGQKLKVHDEDPEMISNHLFNMLRNVKYKPGPEVDIAGFRKNLITGDRFTIFSVLQWILRNSEKVKKYAYLAKFLVRPEIPSDILGNADMAELLEVHDKLIEEFKEAHKQSVSVGQHNSTEIINDLKEMAMERDVVIKRLETTQLNLSDRTNKEHLLNVAKSYRIQQDKNKNLTSQLREQEDKLKKATEHLQRNLVSLRGQAPAPKTPRELVQRLSEDLKVNEYLAKEKHPQELKNLQRDISVLHSVQNHDHITRDNLLQIQEKNDAVNREIDNMVQKKMAMLDPQDDKLTPFRQQAAVIKRNKQLAAEKLEELKSELREIEGHLADKQIQVQQLLGDSVLRGEELKKYVNKLRTKSTVYKRQRTDLAALKSEAGVLTRTLEILHSRDPTLEIALLNHKKLNVNLENSLSTDEGISLEDLSKRSSSDLQQMISQLNQKLNDLRHEMMPIGNRLRPLKEQFQTLQQQYEQKKRVHDSTSINLTSQLEPLEKEVNGLKKTIETQEDEWKVLKQRIDKAEELLQTIDEENRYRNSSTTSPKRPSKMETLQMQINHHEKQAALLKEEQKIVSERQAMLGEQSVLWGQLLELFECKLQCMKESEEGQGSVTITKQAQTLTL